MNDPAVSLRLGILVLRTLLYQYHTAHWKGGRERVEEWDPSDWLCEADGHLTRGTNLLKVPTKIYFCYHKKYRSCSIIFDALYILKNQENSVRYVLWLICHLLHNQKNECIIYVDSM